MKILDLIKSLFKRKVKIEDCVNKPHEHSWVIQVEYDSNFNEQENCLVFDSSIFKICNRCGSIRSILQEYDWIEEEKLTTHINLWLKIIKNKNPDYFVIGIDDL